MRSTIFVVFALSGMSLSGMGCSHAPKANMKDAPESCRTKVEIDEKKISHDPIMEAIFEGNSEELKKLIASSQDGVQKQDHLQKQDRIQKKDALGLSYLHLAAGVGNSEVIEILIGAGIPVNSKLGKKQSTPAHSAVTWGKVASLRTLQKNGADFSIKNADHKTPAALATEFKNSEVLEFFRSRQVQSN